MSNDTQNCLYCPSIKICCMKAMSKGGLYPGHRFLKIKKRNLLQEEVSLPTSRTDIYRDLDRRNPVQDFLESQYPLWRKALSMESMITKEIGTNTTTRIEEIESKDD